MITQVSGDGEISDSFSASIGQVNLGARPTADDLNANIAKHSRASRLEFSWYERETGEDYQLVLQRNQKNFSQMDWTLSTSSSTSVTQRWSKTSGDIKFVAESVEKLIGEVKRKKFTSNGSASETFHALPSYADKLDKFDSASVKESFHEASSLSALDKVIGTKPKEPERKSNQDLKQVLTNRRESLKGNLAQIEIANLIQSIKGASISGRLKVLRKTSYIHIFFVDGQPNHAEGSRGVGEDSFLQSLCWTSGQFEFEPRLKTSEHTITTPLDALLLQGVQLKDCTELLKSMGLHMQTLMRLKETDLSTSQLESKLSPFTFDIELEKAIYRSLQGMVKSLQEIIEEFWLLRSMWVPALASLFRAGLVEVFERGEGEAQHQAKVLDMELVGKVENTLIDKESGILSYGPFLFMLNQYFHLTPDMGLALLLIDAVSAKGSQGQNGRRISAKGMSMIVQEINAIPNLNCMIGHYEDKVAVAILNCSYKTVRKTGNQIYTALRPSTLELAVQSVDTTQVGIGCAHYPDDCEDLSVLCGAAEHALAASLKQGGGLAFARDV